MLPTIGLLAVCGYLFAVGAGRVIATDKDSGATVADALKWRLPFTMAAWGGGMVLVFELFRSLWGKREAPAPVKPQAVDSEQLLLQLLEQAEAAEAARRSGTIPVPPSISSAPGPVSVSDQTPPPVRIEPSPLPLPEFNFPAPPPNV